MDEFGLIRRLARATAVARADVALGIGDDAALLVPPRGSELALAVDTLVAGVHFPCDTAPAAIGWKALAVNLSDLAAMGAEPAWATLALTLPAVDAHWIDAFARGFARLARRYRVALVGGDTTRGPLTVSVQAAGFVPRGRALRRAGARAGDLVCMSGTPGEAAAGLALRRLASRSGGPAAPHAADRDRRALIRRLEYPQPRVALGLALRGLASAAIDVSDGLLQDLGHVLAASGVGAQLDAGALPVSRALAAVCPDRRTRLRRQLAGGDDYELVFTVPPARAALLARRLAGLAVPVTRIGRVRAARGIVLAGAGGLTPEALGGWRHFVGGGAR